MLGNSLSLNTIDKDVANIGAGQLIKYDPPTYVSSSTPDHLLFLHCYNMSSHNSVAKSLKMLGKATMAHVKDVNKSGGPQWLSAINVAAQAVQGDVRTLSHTQSRLTITGVLISLSSRISMVFRSRLSTHY